MKKISNICLITFLIISVFCFPSCENNTEDVTAPTKTPDATNISNEKYTDMYEHFDALDYAEYYNIFVNGEVDTYLGKEIEKEGTYFILEDSVTGYRRSFVWGYADATRCCDYQWEFVPESEDVVPTPRTHIKVKGVFNKNDMALDDYWIENAMVTFDEQYDSDEKYDFDLTTASPTLVTVQMYFINDFVDEYIDKTLKVYGRAYSSATIEHPAFDNTWHLNFIPMEEVSPGTYLLLGGTIKNEDGFIYLDTFYQKSV